MTEEKYQPSTASGSGDRPSITIEDVIRMSREQHFQSADHTGFCVACGEPWPCEIEEEIAILEEIHNLASVSREQSKAFYTALNARGADIATLRAQYGALLELQERRAEITLANQMKIWSRLKEEQGESY